MRINRIKNDVLRHILLVVIAPICLVYVFGYSIYFGFKTIIPEAWDDWTSGWRGE